MQVQRQNLQSSAGRSAFEPLEGRTLLAGAGLAGAYFARVNHTLAKFSQTDATIDFDWSGGTPAASLGTDGFSVRWAGRVMPKFSETYSFITRSSGGLRLWVNDALIIDSWQDHSEQEDSGTIRLLGGQRYDIRLDYWSDGNDPMIRLDWESARRTRETIPSNRLFGAVLDEVDPSEPFRFRSTYASESTIKLMWGHSDDPSGIVAYDVYVNSSKVHTTAPGETSYIRRSLSPSTGYTFSIQAIDPAGNLSPMVSTAVATAASANNAPSVPSGLRFTNVGPTALTLVWNPSSDDQGVTGYRIYRNGVKLGIAPTATSFTDTGLSPGTAYSYMVRAADGSGLFSGFSAAAQATTVVPAPRDPFGGIVAGDYDEANGVSGSGDDIASLDDGDWVRYDSLNFGSGARSVKLELAMPSSNRGGWIELRIDGAGGQQIGAINVQPTGSWDAYRQQQINITPVSGTHDLYVVFKGRSDIARMRSIEFNTQRLTTIMALGDSITQQFVNTPSYRYYLWHLLQDGGYNVDFVGSQTQAYNGDPPNLDFDQDHEGHSGWRADQLADSISSWSPAIIPDIVLLHAGTNDIEQGQGADNALYDLGRIIDNLRNVNPNVKILMAQVIPTSSKQLQIDDLNAQIPGLAASKSTGQSPVIVVDQNSGFSLSDTSDGIHPNSTGDSKMADKWYSALRGIL